MRLIFSVFLVFLLACHNSQPRHYTEIAFKAKSPMMGMEAPIHVSWNLPKGWIDQPAGDPMRLASFFALDSGDAVGETGAKPVDVSIVQLAGTAGGLPANITRWMGQVKIPASPEIVQDIIAHADTLHTVSGQKGTVVDFTNMLSGDMTSTTSIIGVIIEGPDYMVFVKAMGDQDQLLKLKNRILAFGRSVSISEANP